MGRIVSERRTPAPAGTDPGHGKHPSGGARVGERTCSVDDCERRHYGRGYCQLHYNRVRNTGTAEKRIHVPKTCAVPDCERQANVPGSARGWCAPHYQRWQRWGDPLGAHEPTVGIAECSITGCAALVIARGWCTKHWTRWDRYGDPEARMPGEVVGGRKICPGCGQDKALPEYGKSRVYCKPCSAAIASAYRESHPYLPVPGEPAECIYCGQRFLANKRRWRCCSPACSKAYKYKVADAKHSHARRARIKGSEFEMFDRVEIFERDRWICQLCGELVDPDVPRHDPKTPSIDHIIPIALGGAHTRANVQTACLGCNVRKGARLAA